jgi:hypothetical protein
MFKNEDEEYNNNRVNATSNILNVDGKPPLGDNGCGHNGVSHAII